MSANLPSPHAILAMRVDAVERDTASRLAHMEREIGVINDALRDSAKSHNSMALAIQEIRMTQKTEAEKTNMLVSGVSRVVWLIITAIGAGVMAFVLRGGLVP